MNHLFDRRDWIDLTFDSNLSVYLPPFGRFTFRPLIAVSPDKIHQGAIADSPPFVTSEPRGAELVNAGLPRSNERFPVVIEAPERPFILWMRLIPLGRSAYLPHGSNGSG